MTSPIDVDALGASIYAQGAEEGVLAQIFERAPARRKYCVDIGASDGMRNSNVALLLREQGWEGTLVEANERRFARLAENYRGHGARLVNARVESNTVEEILAGVPEDIGLLNIDIDGNDYWVWRAIKRIRPQVVVVEYNPYYEPPQRWVMKENPEHSWDGTTYYGASLESLYWLGKDKGYELICCDKMGNNAFFVEKSAFLLFSVDDNRPETLFRPAMYKVRFVGKNTFVTGHPYRYGPGDPL